MLRQDKIDCPKCQGKGEIARFNNIAEGVCFSCKGAGKINKPKDRKPKPAKQTPPAVHYTQDELDNMFYECFK